MARNYRSIAILPVASKVLEKTVAAQLMEQLEFSQWLHSQQFGFRPKYSTEPANCYLIERLKGLLVKGHVVCSKCSQTSKSHLTLSSTMSSCPS